MAEDPTWHFDSDRNAGPSMFILLLHEIGHAMGMDHPHEGILLDPALDDHSQTVMSYDWTWSGTTAPDYLSRRTLAPLDVAAMQFLYGGSTIAELG